MALGTAAGSTATAAATSTPGTTDDTPWKMPAHTAENHPVSLSAAGSATTGTPLDCSEEGEGLKRHISTTFRGLLGRALGNFLERRLSAGLNPPALNHAQKLTSQQLTHSDSWITRSGRVYNTKLAKQFRQQMFAKPKAKCAGAVADTCPYTCFYCHNRFRDQSIRNLHMMHLHEDVMSSKLKHCLKKTLPAEPEAFDHRWRGPSPTNCVAQLSRRNTGDDRDFPCSDCGIKFSTPQEVFTHRKAEHCRPEPSPPVPSLVETHCRGTTAASCTVVTSPPDGEAVRLQAMAALQELEDQNRRGNGRGESHVKSGVHLPLASAEGAAKAAPGATSSLPTGFEFVSVEEREDEKLRDTQVAMDLPNSEQNMVDPLCIEEEVPIDLPTAEEGMVDPLSVKEEVDMELPTAEQNMVDLLSIEEEVPIDLPTPEESIGNPLSVKEEVAMELPTAEQNMVDPFSIKDEVAMELPTAEQNMVDSFSIKGEVPIDLPTAVEGMVDPLSVKQEVDMELPTAEQNMVDPLSIEDEVPIDLATAEEGMVDPLSVKGEVAMELRTAEQNMVDPLSIKDELAAFYVHTLLMSEV